MSGSLLISALIFPSAATMGHLDLAPALDPIASRLEAVRQSASAPAGSAQDNAELAKKLSNPIASLISVPFQFNWDEKYGTDDRGERLQLNFQPVIPFALGDEWNLISRTIVPFIDQDDVVGNESQSGVGDITQSFFFSPTEPVGGGWIVGAGPVFTLPTASEDELGTEKWGIGPTAVFLKQQSGWTYGGLVNHVWSFAGEDDRADVNATFLQPFLSHTNASAWTFGTNLESTYDWTRSDWTIPANFFVSKLTRVGKLPISFSFGLRYWLESPEAGPEGLGFRFVVTPLFPK